MNNQQNHYTAWVSRFVLGLGAGAALFLPSLALAQAEPTADETIWGSSSSSDLMDVLQRGQVGSTQTRAEFQRKQDENLNDAAAAFRARQLEVFEAAPPAAPEAESIELEVEEDEPLQSRPMGDSPRPALW